MNKVMKTTAIIITIITGKSTSADAELSEKGEKTDHVLIAKLIKRQRCTNMHTLNNYLENNITVTASHPS